MNDSAARSTWTVNGYQGEYKPVWASSWRSVKANGRPVYFTTAIAAEVAAWRFLYSLERSVMRRDGPLVISARSAAEKLFMTNKTEHSERAEA